MGKPSVFVDTSVFITALLSDSGGSFHVLTNLKEYVRFQTSEYVLDEIADVMRGKLSDRQDLRQKLFLILGIARMAVLPNPPKRALAPLRGAISKKDAPILACALMHSNHLLTLDNEFFNERVRTVADRKRMTVLKPRDLIRLIGART